jgi:alpha-1,2-mannosyltransferase
VTDRRLLLPAAACLLAAAALAALVVAADGAPVGPDAGARRLLSPGDGPWTAPLTELGSGWVLYPCLVLLALLRPSRRTLALPLLLAAGQVLETVLLSVLPRQAPDLTWAGVSSGRTTTAVLGVGLLAWGLRARPGRSIAAGLLAGVVVGAARAADGSHWATDVALGLLVGGALLLVVLAVAPLLPDRPLDRGRALAWLRASPWAWSVTAAAALVSVVPLLLEEPHRQMIDLAVYVGSAGVVGAGGDVYGYRTEAGLPFTYPPFAALVAEPLARLPLGVVRVGWTAATLAAAVAVAAVAMRPVVLRLGLPLTAALLLVSTPVRSHVRFGQVGLFLVLLVAVDLLGRTRRAGWGVGLAAALKLTPAVFLPWLLVVGARRRLRATLAWAAGATAAGLLLLWPSSPSWLGHALWDSGRFGRNEIPGNQSVRGMLLRTDLSEAAAERAWLACAVVLLVAGVVGARRLELGGDRLAAVGVLAATSVAVSPISWQHHLVWLVLPLAALVHAGRHRLACAWAAVLVLPVTTLALQVDVPVLGALLVNTCGLTAVAAVLLLPRLVTGRADTGLSRDLLAPSTGQ